jgi:hypothetical protein
VNQTRMKPRRARRFGLNGSWIRRVHTEFVARGLRQSRLLALAMLVGESFLFWHYRVRMEAPFIVFFLVLSAWTIAIAVLSRSEPLRNGALLCSSVLLSLAVVEACMYYVTKSQIIITGITPEVWLSSARSAGSLPVPDTPLEFREFLAGRMIADVTYGIDANGLREIPAAVQGGPHKVVFFGCSFMFGHGVEDDQTLPYYFVQEAKGTFEGFNFAGEGWGPHQMLRDIETGLVNQVAGTPDLAIYEAIPDHLRRVAGRAPWEDGPKYEICRGNEACYSGPFHSAYYERWRSRLEKSWTVKFLEYHFGRLSRPSDIPLFLAVLKRSRSLLKENGTRFVIVLWDQNDLARITLETLRANQFDVIALSSIIAESDPTGKYPLTLVDGHPTPATNKAIATYLWNQFGKQLVDAAHSP